MIRREAIDFPGFSAAATIEASALTSFLTEDGAKATPVVVAEFWPARRDAAVRAALIAAVTTRPVAVALRATGENAAPLRTVARVLAPSVASRISTKFPLALRDVAAALPPGIGVHARSGDAILLGPGGSTVPLEPPFLASFSREAVIALASLRRAESYMHHAWKIPELLAAARRFGAAMPSRTAPFRLGLREVLVALDAIVPGKSGCLRRAIAETLADSGAALETIGFGLDVGATGHAWLASDTSARRYDVAFEL